MLKSTIIKKQREWEWSERNDEQSKLLVGALGGQIWCTPLYPLVMVRRFADGTARITVADKSQRHKWAHYQRIKSDLLGEDWEAIEIYPRAERIVDEADLYHLWCRQTPFKIGWDDYGTYTALETFYDEV